MRRGWGIEAGECTWVVTSGKKMVISSRRNGTCKDTNEWKKIAKGYCALTGYQALC